MHNTQCIKGTSYICLTHHRDTLYYGLGFSFCAFWHTGRWACKALWWQWYSGGVLWHLGCVIRVVREVILLYQFFDPIIHAYTCLRTTTVFHLNTRPASQGQRFTLYHVHIVKGGLCGLMCTVLCYYVNVSYAELLCMSSLKNHTCHSYFKLIDKGSLV